MAAIYQLVLLCVYGAIMYSIGRIDGHSKGYLERDRNFL